MALKSYTHTQASPETIWQVPHNLGHPPAVDISTVYNGALQKIHPHRVIHTNANELQIVFSAPRSGSARLIGVGPIELSSTGPQVPQVPPVQPFAFFDNFTGPAGTLDGRISSGDTRAWSEFSEGLILDGSGNMVADSALIHTAPTLQVPLAVNYTGAFAIEVVFASIMGTLEDVTGITFDVAGVDSTIGITVLADLHLVGDILIQAAGMEHTMPMPAQNVPLTLRVEAAAGVSTLFVNEVLVGTEPVGAPLGTDIMLNVVVGGEDIGGGNTMLIDSIRVEELAGPLL